MTNYTDIVHSNLNPHEEGLSTIIANAWRGPFVHSFQMPQKKGSAAVWWNWRKQKGCVSETWSCSSLSDAAKQYAWDDIARPSSETLRQNIIDAIHRQDVESLRNDCLAIFKWGGVARSPADRSRIWVTTTQGSDLIVGITRAWVRTCRRKILMGRSKALSLIMGTMSSVRPAQGPKGQTC